MQNGKLLFACGIITIVPGCFMVGPQYRKPIRPLPASYAKSKKTNHCTNLAQWWTFFNDPCLNNLIEKAIAQNYDLKIAIDKIDELRADYEVSKSKLWPEIDAFGVALRSRQNCDKPTQTSNPFANLGNFLEGGIFTSWEIDLWGKVRHAREAAYAELEAQRESMRDVYIVLLSDVANSYIDIRALQKKISLAQQSISINSVLLTLSKDRFCSGIASDIPNEQQLQELQESKSLLIILQTMLGQTINKLAVLLSENPEDFVLCNETTQIPVSYKKIEVGLPSELLQRRPDIRRAERLLAAATENIGVAIADYFPRFSLLAAVGEATSKNCSIKTPGNLNWTILPFLNWPLITYGKIKFTVDSKKAIERQALSTYAQTIIKALGEVEDGLINYFNEQKRVNLLEEKVNTTTKERNLYKDLLTAGLDTQTNYLLSEKKLIAAQDELTDAQRNFAAATIFVYKSLGGDW